TAGNSTVLGLVINGFASDGIVLSGSGGNTIAGNYIGTDATGTAAVPNGGSGTFVAAPNNRIGGTAPGDGNVISGNTGHGLSLNEPGHGHLIEGNFIGA